MDRDGGDFMPRKKVRLRSLSSISIAALIAAAVATTAHADLTIESIVINDFSSNPMTLAAGPNNTLVISAPASGFTGTGTYQNDTGNAFFGPMPNGPGTSAYIFKPPSTSNTTGQPALEFFSFTSANNLGAVSMEIDWTLLEGGLLGAATVSSSSGEFIPEFPLDSSATVVCVKFSNFAGTGDVGRGRARSPRVAQRRPRPAAVRRPRPAGPLFCAP
jgi:hypothetical protein